MGTRIIHRDLNIRGEIIGRDGNMAKVKYDNLKFVRVELLSKLKKEE